jgi:hypothetical protein
MSVEWTNESLFYRQVHPNWSADGVPNSVAFGPTPKDKDQLSVDDASLVSAEGSWRHFTEKLGLISVGTWAVSMGDVEEAGDLELAASPSVVAEDPDRSNPAHCHVDFSGVTSKGQKKRRAQHLAIKATARGRLYIPAS